MRAFFVSAYAYGVFGMLIWFLYSFPLLAAPFIGVDGGFDWSHNLSSIVVYSFWALGIIAAVGLSTAWPYTNIRVTRGKVASPILARL